MAKARARTQSISLRRRNEPHLLGVVRQSPGSLIIKNKNKQTLVECNLFYRQSSWRALSVRMSLHGIALLPVCIS